MESLESIAARFAGKRVVIVGDLVADQFVSGAISRVSREAPVFIMRHEQTETRAGGAANAAVNVASLGGMAELIGLIGDDANGRMLTEELRRQNVSTEHLMIDESIKTTTKMRVLTGQQYAPRHQVIRIDYESSAPISESVCRSILDRLELLGASADAIVISDYNYGVASLEVHRVAKKIASSRNIPLLVDSRFNLGAFCGATSATPNQEEVEQLLGSAMNDASCHKLRQDLELNALLVTCGNKGMRLYESGNAPQLINAVGSDAAVDVTGAGDTVIAAYSLSLASGYGFADAARVANHAGGIVVMKKGTASVSLDELTSSLRSEHANVARSI